MCPDTSSSDPTQGFTVTNNTGSNIYIGTAFDPVTAGQVSNNYTKPGSYIIRNNGTNNGAIYLTVVISSVDNGVNILPTTTKGNIVITATFA
jgi:hypothetical protein